MTDAPVATATDKPPTLVQKLAAEALGTAILVIIGCGAAFTTGADIAATGLAFGIAIVMMVYSFGRVSGGHFNPAVSVGAALGGRISWKESGLYSAAQVVGGIVGGLILAIVVVASDIGWEFGEPLAANGFGDQGGAELLGALLVEILLTFVFLTVILSVVDARNEHPALAPLAIGLSLAAIHFVAIPLTGTSVNPARSIGVGLWSGGDAIVQLWLFILAPLLGAALAGVLYPLVFGRDTEPVPGSGLRFGGAGAAVTAPGYGAPDAFQQQWSQQGDLTGQPGYQTGQTGQTGYAAPAEQPIIQDGWQWDPAAQQWIPAPQPPTPPATGETQMRPPGS